MVDELDGTVGRLARVSVGTYGMSARRNEARLDRTEATKEATLLLELAIARSRVSSLDNEGARARVNEVLKQARWEILRLEEFGDDRAGLDPEDRSITDAGRTGAQERAMDPAGWRKENDLPREA
ncbi:hypothetical protein GBA63_13935 [Rubrobacter tropicus]|uniref:Uncharacterized protein n=1 Tax=Rubrobacter tropicus TaxID=2653851 RepID=A0A6G8QAV2_9ACTN|nr:hypothetical protein [Rubrobacter tropicus]QIN83615.1 hypothetical protein GBA63_13935 [Rubrobacter tropicus]